MNTNNILARRRSDDKIIVHAGSDSKQSDDQATSFWSSISNSTEYDIIMDALKHKEIGNVKIRSLNYVYNLG